MPKKMKMTLTMIPLLVLLVLVTVTPAIHVQAALKQPTWPLKWTRLLDVDSRGSINIIAWDSSDDGKNGIITFYGLPSRVFVLRLSDGSSLFSTDKFRTPSTAPLYQLVDSSSHNKYVAWISTGRNPQLHVYYRATGQETVMPLNYVEQLDPDRLSQPVSIRIGSSGKYIIIGDRNGFAAVYGPRQNQADGKDHDDDDLGEDKLAASVFSPISSAGPTPILVAAGSGSGQQLLFDASTGSTLWTSAIASATVQSVAISDRGDFVAYGSTDKGVRYFAKAGTARWTNTTLDGAVSSIAMSADGDKVIAGTSGTGKSVYLWSSAKTLSGSVSATWRSTGTGKPNKLVESVAISAGGTRAVAGTDDPGLFYYNTNSPTPLWSVTAGIGNVHKVAIASDGSFVVAGSADKKVYLFNASASSPTTPQWTYSTGGDVRSVAVSLDGATIVAGSEDKNVYLFSLIGSTPGTPIWTFPTRGIVRSVDVSSDGSLVVAGGDDGYIYLLDGTSGSLIWRYTQKGLGAVLSVSITSDGVYVVAGTANSKVLLFQTTNKPKPVWIYTAGGSVASVAVSSTAQPFAQVLNTGQAVTLNDKTSLVYVSWDTGKVYTGRLVSILDESGNEILLQDRNTNTGKIGALATVTLVFDAPKTNSQTVPSGNYKGFVQIEGFSSDGDKLNQKLRLGNLTLG